ncbi:MAG TPA: mannose-1-phosphate guanylyltransferase [Bacteroidales bacterium]|nr:mannose-1-phosphate guanylyltransferase [Bacteroidales bacterium]HRZ77829.1 mannose-1-phosphate guanylyltransferase [Bacteroidales bacterium]
MNEHYYGVIMAGGVGTRFWPMSRKDHPKQFIDILGTGETLIQQTVRRFRGICPEENIFIVTNADYTDLVRKQLPGIRPQNILSEPSRRNTAPCIAYATHKIGAMDPDAVLVVAPSDHIILKEDEFRNDILAGLRAAEENEWLLTLGIRPSRPDTGYGYIQFDEKNAWNKDHRVAKVVTFTEKPQLEMARSFLASGDFLWNSGIFIWSLRSVQKAFKAHLPELYQLFSKGQHLFNTPDEQAFIVNAYTVCKSISIDYGVMEKADNVHVIAADFGWSDLGTWGSLYDTQVKDEKGNSIVGDYVMAYDTNNCIINMPTGKLAVIQGMDGYIIVEDDGILLICRREDEQQIRQFVNDVKVEKGEEYV